MNDQNPLSSEKPLFLAPKARVGDGHGYVNRPELAMRDEPECVGPAILDGYAESARFYESLRHQSEVLAAQQARQLRSAEDRLRDAQARARRTHIDLSHEFHICRDMLARAKSGGRKEPPAAVRVIEKIEGALDGLNKAA